MPCHITVIGDSSSSGVGAGGDCYPAKLARLLGTDLHVRVLNTAVPGFTSADASRFFRAIEAAHPHDYVIVYLGNNEGAVGAAKGRYRAFRTWAAERWSAPPPRQFRPVLSPPRFRFTYDEPSCGVATTPEEFRDNLRAIVGRARRRGARVILVNPVANGVFPGGLGHANSTYFCLLDGLDRCGAPLRHQPIDEASAALADGLRRLADEGAGPAIETWQPWASLDDVAGFIARHNIACARALRRESGAEDDLRSLLGVRAAYDATVLYNLAMLRRRAGDSGEAARLLDEAYEHDHSLYRIRRAYRSVIDSFAGEGVRVLDLKPLLTASNFVDYCHPTGDGHDAIAGALAALVRADAPTAAERGSGEYEVMLPTPDYLRRPGETLVDYYCIDWPLGQAEIGAALAEARRRASAGAETDGDELVPCLENFLKVNDAHPAFAPELGFDGAWAPRSHEVLSCPEQYLYRVLFNYSRAFERDGCAARLAAGQAFERVRWPSSDYARITLRAGSQDLTTDLNTSRAYLEAVETRLRAQLQSDGPIYQATVGQRLRGVMTWFTREALRYGTQSRLSMLYARWDLERLLEGLVTAIVIADRRRDAGALARLDGLVSRVLSLLGIHERHARRYHENDAFAIEAYDADLSAARRAIASQLVA